MFADFFLPTERNNFLPRVLAPEAFVAYLVLASALILSPTYLRHLQLASLTAPFAWGKTEVVDLVNASRVANGLASLKENPTLDAVAAAKAQDMFAKQYFAHTAPDNRTPWDFLRTQSYTYLAAGENLAIDFATAAGAHQAMLDSPTHRANIMGGSYTEIGVAVREGTFQDHPSIIVVEYFGKPKPTALAVTKPAPAKTPAAVATSRPKQPPQTPVSPSPATVSSTQVAVSIIPRPAVQSPTVLGTASPAVETTPAPLSAQKLSLVIRFGAGVVVCLLLLALGLLLIRSHRLPLEVVFRSLVILALLGYAALVGAPTGIEPHLTAITWLS